MVIEVHFLISSTNISWKVMTTQMRWSVAGSCHCRCSRSTSSLGNVYFRCSSHTDELWLRMFNNQGSSRCPWTAVSIPGRQILPFHIPVEGRAKAFSVSRKVLSLWLVTFHQQEGWKWSQEAPGGFRSLPRPTGTLKFAEETPGSVQQDRAWPFP